MRPRAHLSWLLVAAAVAGACGPRDIAGACSADDECETGECYTDSDPGYCTSACENEGSTSECPADTVCKRIEGGAPRCLLVCDDDAACPSNSDCNNVPESSLMACEPVR